MNRNKSKHKNMTRIVCLIIALGMILSAFASGFLMFFN
ncbi:flagellar basal body-associated protein FliL [Sedimentibacter acidaminivorans]|uniref:Flagellar basal body-associated protein FliL n=1 Tax=Sedimentibacter acidaminivorans TaxID=913099 RepID=A0ABS4GI20_9FIRM|nr:flagellar basal body-associated protein FliL [Sedimentibacter acidaminivorans]